MLTSIISPGVLGVMLVVVLTGTGIMTRIVSKKYGYTPEREEEMEQAAEESRHG